DPGGAPSDRGVATRIPLGGGGRAQEPQPKCRGAGVGPNPGQAGRDDDEARARRDPHRKKGLYGRPEEAQEIRGMVSPSTDQRYPLTMICSVFRTARSSVYAAAAMGGGRAAEEGRVLEKRGPKTTHSDAELLEEIRAVLVENPVILLLWRQPVLRTRLLPNSGNSAPSVTTSRTEGTGGQTGKGADHGR